MRSPKTSTAKLVGVSKHDIGEQDHNAVTPNLGIYTSKSGTAIKPVLHHSYNMRGDN